MTYKDKLNQLIDECIILSPGEKEDYKSNLQIIADGNIPFSTILFDYDEKEDKEIQKLAKIYCLSEDKDPEKVTMLARVFPWHLTPQGPSYWLVLDNLLFRGHE